MAHDYSRTDRQSKNCTLALIRNLGAYVVYYQDDSVGWVSTAEFAANKTESCMTRLTPFFTDYGYQLQMSFESDTILQMNTAREGLSVAILIIFFVSKSASCSFPSSTSYLR